MGKNWICTECGRVGFYYGDDMKYTPVCQEMHAQKAMIDTVEFLHTVGAMKDKPPTQLEKLLAPETWKALENSIDPLRAIACNEKHISVDTAIFLSALSCVFHTLAERLK